MLSLFLFFFLPYSIMSDSLPYCPAEKKVGDTCYTIVQNMTNTEGYGCYQNCTYRKVNSDDGRIYCFKEGMLPVTDECYEISGPIGTSPSPTTAIGTGTCSA